MQRFVSALILCGVLAPPVLAEDALPQRCTLFCKIWRNVSGRVQTSEPAPTWDDGAVHVSTIDEDARVPRPSDLVAVHGELIRKSRAERQRERAELAEDLKRIDALRAGSSEVGRGEPPSSNPRVGRAD
jgi:hypothetical protein